MWQILTECPVKVEVSRDCYKNGWLSPLNNRVEIYNLGIDETLLMYLTMLY